MSVLAGIFLFALAAFLLICLLGLIIAWPLVGIPAAVVLVVYFWRSHKGLLAAADAETESVLKKYAPNYWRAKREAAELAGNPVNPDAERKAARDEHLRKFFKR